MHIGLLTSPFGPDTSFKDIAEWAAGAGFTALEVDCSRRGQLTPERTGPAEAREVRAICTANGLRISGLAFYEWMDLSDGGLRVAAELGRRLALAEAVGAACLCTFAGCPAPGRDRHATIREVLPGMFAPLVADAGRRGVGIAFENWYETNLQNLDHFRAVAEALPQPHVGFNFDPSHLAWQGIDYLAAVAEFRGRILHSHAKDVRVHAARRARLGVLGQGWWEYVIPGCGEVRWGEYLHQLRGAGYDGVLSIEHEDRAFDARAGAVRGRAFLASLI